MTGKFIPKMGRKYQTGFLSVLIPLALMSVVVFNADEFRRAGRNIYLYYHPRRSSAAQSNSVYGGNDKPVAHVKRLLAKEEITDTAKYSSQDMNTAINGVTYNENRVLYKFYKATQDPSYDCVIRILKYRRPKAEEVYLNNDEWMRSKCEGMPCSVETRYSLNMKDFWDSDVVVIMPGNEGNFEWKYLLRSRPPGQLWALYSRESPVHEPQFTPPSSLFKGNPYNLSMTYRSGSDVDLSYGHFVRDSPSNVKGGTKSRLMMWMASRCEPLGWERTKFVHNLQEHLDVHIYGKCGTFECPKHDWDNCLIEMQKYKFYLSLENSECSEYITEKFWSNAFATGMVPIVFGARKEDYVRTAPPHSFIHLNDFSTMEEFVEYINLLDRNETLYNKYFEWKKFGRTYMGTGFRTALNSQNLCNLTKKLVEITLYPENSWRGRTPDFGKWWNPTCEHQTELLGVNI
ncbi:galactoside 3(4)-L-fucosyltransferase [Strongylocentrotus purpuratus]|uniref:Fucosyltransferase n=1 Tax=Strongylocentrotus purpuratus TaxID=7668 RepID=A0A7M7G3M5_STRPU|nr:galactoside 3(4)-L-fucosyltransferase [Strongylocentrotus purpuratus]XP_030828130.1 galactoside 3(4)-L-fucosyltransferase [Strongylocentrotus purpuratus]